MALADGQSFSRPKRYREFDRKETYTDRVHISGYAPCLYIKSYGVSQKMG